MRPAYAVVGPPVEWPDRTAVAIAAFMGIVVGAIGGGVLASVQLFVLILIAVGVWRAVTYLAAILQVAYPPPVDGPHETVRSGR